VDKLNLAKLRKVHGYTGDYMANLLSITKATYSKKENGNIKISLEEANVISKLFNKSIEEIFFETKVSIIEIVEGGEPNDR
jgi:DNA-binding XRE family transcriptional regulator